MLKKLFIGFTIFLCATTAHADAIGKLKSFITSTRSGQANFIQEMLDKNGKQIQMVSGTMQFIRPNKFRWTYQKPYEQIIVGDGEKFWLYDVDLNQVTVKSLNTALGSSPATLLSGNNEIERGFTLRDISCDAKQKAAQMQPESAPAASNEYSVECKDGHESDGLEWLEAIPKTPDASIEKIRMAFNRRSELIVMELYDSFGNNTVLHFAELKRNPRLPAKLFKFEPPPGADILSDE